MLGFINFPAIKFRKSKICYELLNDIFIEKERENTEWRNAVLDAFFESEEEFERVKNGEDFYVGEYFLRITIHAFTEKNRDLNDIKNQLIIFMKEDPKYFKSIEFVDDNHLKIMTANGVIDVRKLSAVYPKILDIFPEIETDGREQQCHAWTTKAIQLASIDKPICLATGYIAPFSDKRKYLHSWLEVEVGGETLVVDLAKNVLCNKKGYYQYQNIQGHVHRISRQDLVDEYDTFRFMEYRLPLYSKLYLANRPLALKIYNQTVRDEQKERESDPLYRAAENMRKGFEKREAERRKQLENVSHSEQERQ